MSLELQAWRSLAILTPAMGFLLFTLAGTFQYKQAWVYLLIFTSSSVLTTAYLIKHDMALLARRMKGGPLAEKRPVQKLIMKVTSIGFVALLAVPALDFRFDWSALPIGIVIAGDILVILGFFLIFFVYRVNTYSSATIEISENQKVISTGPYAIVRHPLYVGGLLYLMGTPLALGSAWGFVVFDALIPFLLWRIVDEEKFLKEKLPGYEAYQKQVPYRLIPFIW